jgi:acyl carrier protein
LPAWPEADEPETNTPGEARWRSRHAAEIRQRAKARLPDYLVPNRVISVDELPLTTNGKIDRVLLSSLPLPSKDRDANDRAMTAMEKLTAFWFSKALGVDEIAHMDDFFDLGGNSLLAMRLVADITDTTGAEFPIENVFRDSTVQGVARELEKVLGEDDVAASVLELLTSGASKTVLDSDGRDA